MDDTEATERPPSPTTTKTEKFLVLKSHAIVYSHTWNIGNISNNLKTQYSLSKTVFAEERRHRMSLKLLNKNTRGFRSFIGLRFIVDSHSANRNNLFKFSAWIIDEGGERVNYTKDNGPFHRLTDDGHYMYHTFDEFIPRFLLLNRTLRLIGEDDVLRITCVVEVLDTADQLHVGNESIIKYPVLRGNTLADEFYVLLKDGAFSDVTLAVGLATFKVHRAILAARSPVFEGMFRNEMKEKEGNVTIVDYSAEVIKQMLIYVYTGQSPNLEEHARELMSVANKYDLPGLTNLCEVHLATKITVENAAELLMRADMYNAHQLKNTLLQFIARQAESVLQTNDWKKLAEDCPQLVEDVLENVTRYIGKFFAQPTPTRKRKWDFE